jgi:hypothetical protein
MTMSASASGNGEDAPLNQPPLLRDERGRVDVDSVPDVIQWFLDYDQRVAIVKHPRVEEIFQWKQQHSRNVGEEVFIFNRAEDRLAIGIIQALAENPNEPALHDWISKLLNALETASKANEAATEAYALDLRDSPSTVQEAEKIPSQRGRTEFLLNCWVETLCSAEARVLGWLYKEFYGHPFVPSSV